MESAAALIAEHAAVLAHAEFRAEAGDARIRLELSGAQPEAWLATGEGQRLVLRPAAAGDPEPDLVLRMSEADFVAHLNGRIDLLSPVDSRVLWLVRGAAARKRGGRTAGPIAKRMLSALSLACQVGPTFRGSTIERLYLAARSPREDGGFEPMGDWSLPFPAGKILYDLALELRPARTIEVGMAHGLSTLFIAQALRANGTGRHVAIDPWQSRGFGRCGVMNLRAAGLEELVEVIEQPNFTALPRLLEAGAESYQLAFIDGLHVFDHVLLDFFYCDRLVAPGGLVAFDDSLSPAVSAVLDFVRENRGSSYERVAAASNERLTVLRRLAPDRRVDQHGVDFHRPFSTLGPDYVPLRPPRTPRRLKRAFDLAVALAVGLLLLPLGLAVALAIWAADLVSGAGLGSPLQREPCVSRGRLFDQLTFRTHRRGGSPEQPSRLGRLLVKTRVFKLPLLLNVVAGSLSLVGPSPIAPSDRARRQLFKECGLRAGVTGPEGRGGEYYAEYVARSQTSLLVYDLSLLARAAARQLPAGAPVRRER